MLSGDTPWLIVCILILDRGQPLAYEGRPLLKLMYIYLLHLIPAAFQMDAINIDAIREAEEWLQLDFTKARTEGIPNRAITAREVWNKSKEEEHKKNFRRITTETDRKPGMDLFGLLRNEAKRWGGNILVLGRQSVTGVWVIGVGAGGSFSASRGHNKAEVARDASVQWVTDLMKRCREAGPENVLVGQRLDQRIGNE